MERVRGILQRTAELVASLAGLRFGAAPAMTRRWWVRVASAGAAVAALVAAAPEAPRLADAETVRLATEVVELLGRYPWRAARWSVFVVSLDRGDTLVAVMPDTALAPASNMKLLTSAAALRELGPGYRFRTWLLSDGVLAGGELRGDLVLYGTGDPGISDRFYESKVTVFEELADQLLARGVRRVTGDLVGDASYLPGPLRPEGWNRRDLNDYFAAAVSALSFNENVVSIRVEPAQRSGWRPAVHTLPEHSGLVVDNRAVTVEGPGRVFVQRDEPMAPVVVEGRIQRGGRAVWREITVSDPATFALAAFRAVLDARGIAIGGSDRVVRDPAESLLGANPITAPTTTRRRTRIFATRVSPPLREYLAVMNKRSNNLFTELVFRTVGRVREGSASPSAPARAVASSLAELGVDTAGLIQLDGSGLAAENRVRTATLVDVLTRMASSADWNEFWATLPVAGNRRELGRMYRTPAAGNLRAKTGTIEGVSALSGVVASQDGERLAFSILVNGTPSTTRAKRIENEIGVRLASFHRAPGTPPLATVVQLPPAPLLTDSGGPARHRVLRGESLDRIARRYGLTLEELLRANPDVEPRRLQIGSRLVIPQASGGGDASAP